MFLVSAVNDCCKVAPEGIIYKRCVLSGNRKIKYFPMVECTRAQKATVDVKGKKTVKKKKAFKKSQEAQITWAYSSFGSQMSINM